MKPRLLSLIVLLLILILASACNSETGTPVQVSPKDREQVLVVHVIDGDTIEIEGGQHVRYIGIDTPEVEGPYTSNECFGSEASEKNRELVEGKHVWMESDKENKDQYGRLLRYVYIDDIMVNAELIRLGYARAVSYPPNTKYHELFLKLEREAAQSGTGLWGACST